MQVVLERWRSIPRGLDGFASLAKTERVVTQRVVPAEAGTQGRLRVVWLWIPAFAGMTELPAFAGMTELRFKWTKTR
jgi:hypothetical protein